MLAIHIKLASENVKIKFFLLANIWGLISGRFCLKQHVQICLSMSDSLTQEEFDIDWGKKKKMQRDRNPACREDCRDVLMGIVGT